MPALGSLMLTLLLLSIAQYSYSEIYKWVDSNGNIQFTDKKPKAGNKKENVKFEIITVKTAKINKNSTPDDLASSQKVILYSASWCGVCKAAKKYFKQQGIPYQEYDIEKSVKGRSDFKRLRGRGVPIIIAGKQRMDGFDIAAFEEMYRG